MLGVLGMGHPVFVGTDRKGDEERPLLGRLYLSFLLGESACGNRQRASRCLGEALKWCPSLGERLGELIADWAVKQAHGLPVLCHGDLGSRNMLVGVGRLTALVDWGDAEGNEPARDLGWFPGAMRGIPFLLREAAIGRGLANTIIISGRLTLTTPHPWEEA